MQEPLTLYVDELTHDKTKGTVSDAFTVIHNLRTISRVLIGDQAMWQLSPRHTAVALAFGNEVRGLNIFAAGRYICIIVKGPNGGIRGMSMVLLNLRNDETVAKRIAEKFENEDLQNRFMEVFSQVMSQPENHGKFRLAVRKPPPSPPPFSRL